MVLFVVVGFDCAITGTRIAMTIMIAIVKPPVIATKIYLILLDERNKIFFL